jgi:hypothetical protein
VLASDGVPAMNNPLDPADGRRQAERGQRTQHKVQAALERQRGGPAAMVPAPDMAAMQARAMQMQAQCGQDRECLMREASAMASARVAAAAGGNASVQARLQGYGAAIQACERQHKAAAAREACIAQARRQHGGSDESDHDEAVDTPYLYFVGRTACQVDIANRIDERIQGAFADVQGQVGFTQTALAELRHRDAALCPLLQAVLDTRSGRLWTAITLSPTEPQGVITRSESARKTERTTGGVPLQWHEASDWLQRKLSQLSAAGEDQLRLPAGRPGRPDGQTEIKLRWRFEPV